MERRCAKSLLGNIKQKKFSLFKKYYIGADIEYEGQDYQTTQITNGSCSLQLLFRGVLSFSSWHPQDGAHTEVHITHQHVAAQKTPLDHAEGVD